MNGNIQDYNRFSIKSNTTNVVQADYIAQVIDVKGNFFIEHNGVLATTNNIWNGDTLLLKEGAQVVFEINSGTQSKIIGPAKLIIQKNENENYKLNLIYGDFIQMEGKEQTKQTIELAINDITVKQQDKTKPLNFKFVKNGKNQIFQNNWANIIVSKNNEKNKTTTISNQEVVAIQNNDIKTFANIDSFTKAIKEKNISQTFALSQETSTGTAEKEGIMLLSLLNSPEITENKDEVTQKISAELSDEKMILDPSQDEKVSSSLYEWFYTPELKELEKAFIEGNESTFTLAYAKIEKRIQSVYQNFGSTYNKISGEPATKLQNLKAAIQELQEKITKEYNVPPKYNQNLSTIGNTISNILAKGYASSAIHNAPEEIQE